MSAAYGSTGAKGSKSAAKTNAKAVSFLPKKEPRKREPKPIPLELALASFGEPLIPQQEE